MWNYFRRVPFASSIRSHVAAEAQRLCLLALFMGGPRLLSAHNLRELSPGPGSPMMRALLLVCLILMETFARSAPPPVASQSACPDTMSDLDRIACWVSAGPEPLR